jgi:hypothetical protein
MPESPAATRNLISWTLDPRYLFWFLAVFASCFRESLRCNIYEINVILRKFAPFLRFLKGVENFDFFKNNVLVRIDYSCMWANILSM